MPKITKQRRATKATKKVSQKKGKAAVKKGTSRKPTRKPKPKTSEGEGIPGTLAIAMYGPGGVGKTSFCAHFPKPKFIIGRDKGILDLVEFDQVPEPHSVDEADSWEDILRLTAEACDTDCETVVFDNLTDMEELCFQYHCDTHFNGDWSDRGFYSFQKGPKNAAKTDWPDLLSAANDLLDCKKHVIFLGHSKVKNTPNPDGADWLRYEPDMETAIWSRTHYWAKCTLFYALHAETKKDGTRAKAASDEYNRFIFTQPSPVYEAKNRFGLPPVIDAGSSGEESYEAFVGSFQRRRTT